MRVCRGAWLTQHRRLLRTGNLARLRRPSRETRGGKLGKELEPGAGVSERSNLLCRSTLTDLPRADDNVQKLARLDNSGINRSSYP